MFVLLHEKGYWYEDSKLSETALAGMLALAGTCPQVLGAFPAAAPPAKATTLAPSVPVKATPPVKTIVAAPVAVVAVDPKSPEGQLIAAQGQIVAGNLDAGLKSLPRRGVKAGPALAPRIGFVQKLVEIRVADRLGIQPKVATGLTEAMKQATKPDQVAACWQLGLGLARAAVTAKSPAAAGLIGFLGTQAAPAMRQAGPHIELARLHLATGRPAAAEAELGRAAPRANSRPSVQPGRRPWLIWPRWWTRDRRPRPAPICSSGSMRRPRLPCKRPWT